MAWRPRRYLLEGTLDNTTPGRVTGVLVFQAGPKTTLAARLDLEGDFDVSVGGTVLELHPDEPEPATLACREYMATFADAQAGLVGDIKAEDEVVYIEWFSDRNGRVVIELSPDEVTVR